MPQSLAPDGPVLTRMLNEFLAAASRMTPPLMSDSGRRPDLHSWCGHSAGKAELMKGVRSSTPIKVGEQPPAVFTAEDIRIQQYGNVAVVAFSWLPRPKRMESPSRKIFQYRRVCEARLEMAGRVSSGHADSRPRPPQNKSSFFVQFPRHPRFWGGDTSHDQLIAAKALGQSVRSHCNQSCGAGKQAASAEEPHVCSRQSIPRIGSDQIK